MNNDKLLEKISIQGIDSTPIDEMVSLACAFWHEDFLPDTARIRALDEEQQRRAGYLTEFFSTFNCVDEQRALALQTFANDLKSETVNRINEDNPDELAQEWGLTENLDQHLAELLHYQTRHYKHGK